MFNPWVQWDEFAAGQRAVVALGQNALRRERRVVPDRMNPFTAMSDREFVERFRLKKDSVNEIIVKIGNHLPDSMDRRGKLSVYIPGLHTTHNTPPISACMTQEKRERSVIVSYCGSSLSMKKN